jgi:hypothetical protein
MYCTAAFLNANVALPHEQTCAKGVGSLPATNADRAKMAFQRPGDHVEWPESVSA